MSANPERMKSDANAPVRPSVLVVDDEPQVLRAIEDTLEDQYAVFAETSPQAATRILKEIPGLSVILSDQRMPGMSGDEFLAIARKVSDASRVMITGYADLDAVIRAVNYGQIFGYVSKPWNPDHLKLMVHKAVEHYRLLKDLQHERDLLHNLMDNVPDGIFFKDLEHRFVRLNRTHALRFGFGRPEEGIGRDARALFGREEALEMEVEDDEIVRGGIPSTDRLHRIVTPSGEVRWRSTTKAPIKGKDGRITGVVGIVRDITERQQAQEKISRLNRVHAVLSGINALIVRVNDREELFRDACRIAVEAGGFRFAFVGMIDRDAMELKPIAWEGVDQAFFEVTRSRRSLDSSATSKMRRAIEGKKPIFVNDVEGDAGIVFKKELRERNVRAFGFLPFIVDDQLYGILALFAAEPGFFDEEETKLLLELSGDISFALLHLQKEEQLKRAEQALRESEARYRGLIEQASDGIYVSDPQRRLRLVNSRCCEMSGYSEDELLRMNIEELYGEEERPHLVQNFAQVPKTERMLLERSMRRKDGSRFPMEVSIRVLDDGFHQAIARDITDRKIHEAKIARLTRIYAVLGQINSLIVRVRERDELYREACRIAVEAGGFRFAWLGVIDREAMEVKPVAWEGVDRAYLDQTRSRRSFKEDASRGATKIGPVIRHKKPLFVNDIESDASIVFRKELRERNVRAFGLLPLFVDDQLHGILGLYAAEAGSFDEEETKLLLELSSDISFALDHLQKEERLNYLAYYDPLTGLANRSLFHERLARQIEMAAQRRQKVAVLMVDIERFRFINESIGRHAGDQLLREVARRMIQRSGDESRFARLGPDQFGLIVLSFESADDLARRFEKGEAEVYGSPFRLDDHDLRVSVRTGIAVYPDDGGDSETLMRNAESALKRAKTAGEKYLFFAPQMTERVAEKLALENKLRLALERGELVLHYQPQTGLAERRIVGVEALIRWQSPELGLVPPMDFIPLMEETGLILEAGSWALEQAVRDHRRWIAAGVPAPRVAVNVSPIQLRRPDFVETVKRAIGSEATPPGIDLEITESLIMEDIEANIGKLKAVCDLGINVAIDDFGTGYSSLAYLARLPVHSLKIDRSFIITMLEDANTMTLVSTIISLAHSLGLSVIAEGVDSEEQAKMLHLLRCDQMQGFLFSRPVPWEEMSVLLQKH